MRSDEGTRFVIVTPLTQVTGWFVSAAFVAWAIIATAVLMMDSIGSGSIRDQAMRDQVFYEDRLQKLAAERDSSAREALAAQSRFAQAMDRISAMQSELLASEQARVEFETGLTAIQKKLGTAVVARDEARAMLDTVLAEARETGAPLPGDDVPTGADASVAFLTNALETTAAERDAQAAEAAEAEEFAENLIFEQRLRDERNDQIFRQLEDAVTVSLEPLDKMFEASGMSTNEILDTVKRGYSGQGGPLMPLVISTKDSEIDADTARANEILDALDRMNLYRIAAEKLPFGMPVKSSFRYTSGFGMRWGRLHAGTDMAGPVGSPIYASADGVVVEAGWVSGYGRLIKIKHEFGVETRYGHLSAIKVSKGQRVSRGERIGDMGNSGRSTGPHLHYEIRVGGNPIDPMIYIKAARNVF
ncbi:MAG TPA: peptidase M23 [Rhodobacteraceae bacterium]|nr:peptidase M23 [Paracoccaceae bacterium]